MVTKIFIDIDGNRQPVIRIANIHDWTESDDVRDKLVKGLCEDLSSRLATLDYYSDPDEKGAVIRPAALDTVLYWLKAKFSGDERDLGHFECLQHVEAIIQHQFGYPVATNN